MKELITFLILFPVCAFSSELSLYREPALKNKIEFHQWKKATIAQCGNASCLAKKVLSHEISLKNIEKNPAVRPGHIHPGVALCLQGQGTPLTFYKSNHDEVAVCEFADGSEVHSLDLLSAPM
jgi:hypothetical protein